MTSGGTAPWQGRTLHFVGVGGAGMSGLALVAQALGARVSGSDRSSSPVLERLRAAGIDVALGHSPCNLPAGGELVYSTAVGGTNAERLAARERGMHELHRADLLAEITALPGRRCIAVTGTHGKTTTASMIVHILRRCGFDPGYLVGADVRSTGVNAGWGLGELVVVEADESDRSLLKLHPDIAVLTNAELDHHSTYASLGQVQETFRAFLARARQAVVVWRRPELMALAPPSGAAVIAYDVRAPIIDSAGVRFTWQGQTVRIAVHGLHNALNAVAALEACRLAGLQGQAAAAALADFSGARRRLELLGDSAAGARVYDDYAHHPTEVAATIAAARTLAPARLVVVFQPHLYSRTEAFTEQFATALADADLIAILDIYPARERAEDFPGVSAELLAQATAKLAGDRVSWLRDFAAAHSFLAAQLREGDLCLLMGAGDIDVLARGLIR
jgi:UDP-N-acetylmuramate--alanine ligase